MTDNKSQKEERMVTMKLPADVHASLKLLRKRSKKPTIGESLREFIAEHDPNLMKAGKKIAALQDEISEVDEDKTSTN